MYIVDLELELYVLKAHSNFSLKISFLLEWPYTDSTAFHYLIVRKWGVLIFEPVVAG